MKRVLVTGGAGNVGGALAEGLVKTNKYFVTIVDNLETGSVSKLPSKKYTNWDFYEANVNSFENIAKIMIGGNYDYVFHYAALVGVDRTLARPLDVLEDIKGIEHICKLCVQENVKRLFFSSSSEVYGEPVEFPQNEESTPINSKLPYAKVKAIGESYLQAYHQEYGLDYTIFRFFNTYGPKQSEDFVLGRFIRAAIKGEDITVVGDGSQTRTFCHIDDNLKVTLAALEKGYFLNDIINLGNDNELSILELAKTVIAVLNSNSRIVYIPERVEGDMRRRLPDLTKLRKYYKNPLISLEDGVKMVVDSYMNEMQTNKEIYQEIV
jgi:UDP-glucose 4-epimerase